MPNYIINKLQVIGELDKVEEVMDFIRSDDGECRMDFQKIVPIPPHIYNGNIGKLEEELFGEDTWYGWCPKYWGSKWNAICKEDAARCTEDTVYFQTAWNGVPKLIFLLSAKFDCELVYAFADEDRGYNCDSYVLYKRSDFTKTTEHTTPIPGSKEANDLADELWGKKEEEDE